MSRSKNEAFFMDKRFESKCEQETKRQGKREKKVLNLELFNDSFPLGEMKPFPVDTLRNKMSLPLRR